MEGVPVTLRWRGSVDRDPSVGSRWTPLDSDVGSRWTPPLYRFRAVSGKRNNIVLYRAQWPRPRAEARAPTWLPYFPGFWWRGSLPRPWPPSRARKPRVSTRFPSRRKQIIAPLECRPMCKAPAPTTAWQAGHHHLRCTPAATSPTFPATHKLAERRSGEDQLRVVCRRSR